MKASSYGPADVPASHRAPLRRAQPLHPAVPSRRELAPLERGRPFPRHPHHDRVEVLAALRRTRPGRTTTTRFAGLRVTPAFPPPCPRGRLRGRHGAVARLLRALLRTFPRPLRPTTPLSWATA